MRPEATHSQAGSAIRDSLNNEITRRPKETTAAVTSRRTDAFCVSIVDRDRLYAREIMLFWRYIPEDKLQNLMRQLSVLKMPAGSERVGQKSTAISLIH